MTQPLLAAKDLALGWIRARKKVLLAEGIELGIFPGDFVALIGPNGSGKSTLLRSLVGLQAALFGEVELCGDAIGGLSTEEVARRAACVFTDRFDSGWFTVRDIVAFGRYPYTDARNRLSEGDWAAVSSALASVGLRDFAERRFHELSDGEKQKALIARALAQDTPLLVLDEPTAFLDAPARIEIFHLARALARRQGKAVVISTHDVDLALRFADSLWLFDRAHRFESGLPEALAMSGSLGRAFDGPGVRFDPLAGVFRSSEEHEPIGLFLEIGDETARSWTERLIERLGCVLVTADENAQARLTAAREEGRLVWILESEAGTTRHGDIEALAEAVKRLIRESHSS